MNNLQLPTHMRDLSGIALKNAMIAHKKKEIVKLVCRQTDYTEEEARPLLEENKYNYIKIIKEWLKPPSNGDDEVEKAPKSLNQQVIGEIRNFMDEGYKLTEYRKQQKAYMMRLQELRKKQQDETKLKTIAEEGNKKL